MQRRSVPRTDPRYNQIRAKNNDSVKKSREKSRRERDETISSIQQLEEENQHLMDQIQFMKEEYQQLQDLFKQHTGIAIDQFMQTHPSSSSSSSLSSTSAGSTTTTTTSTTMESSSIEPPKSFPSEPVLTINTQEKSAESSSSTVTSNLDLNPTDLDGAIVIINGVQYRIFSVNKA